MKSLAFQQVAFQLDITFIAPVISQASGAVKHGLDAASLHDDKGNPALPGSLIQGNLKHHWQVLNKHTTGYPKLDFIKKYLPDGTGGIPNRGELTFSDFWSAITKTSGHHLHHRIRIDEKKGKTQPGALQIIDSRYAPGQEVIFRGTISCWLQEEAIQDMAIALYKGMTFMPAAGAFKGIGFGQVKKVKVTPKMITPTLIEDNVKTQEDVLGLIIKPKHALCFSQHLIGNNSPDSSNSGDKTGLDNNFVSEDFIPGGAIKGAIATFLQKLAGKARFPLTDQYLDKIRFTHAQPASANKRQRGCPLPVSIVAVKDESEDDIFYDIAWKKQAGLIYNQAPDFATDWKSTVFEKAAKVLNIPASPKRRISLHTAINSETGASRDHQLFSMELLRPEEREWLSNVTLPPLKTKEKIALLEELKTLFGLGLHWLGKTNASAQLGVTAPFIRSHPVKNMFELNDLFSITLLSDARLLQPGENIPASNGGEKLRECYQKSWCDLSNLSNPSHSPDGGLELSHFYAEQKLIGGHYLHKRFGKPAKKPYNPQLFTKAGSVFIFRVTDPEQVQTSIVQWQRDGLPQLPGVSSRWQDNPYIATNGYGEIAINLTLAEEPKQERSNGTTKEWEPIEEVKI